APAPAVRMESRLGNGAGRPRARRRAGLQAPCGRLISRYLCGRWHSAPESAKAAEAARTVATGGFTRIRTNLIHTHTTQRRSTDEAEAPRGPADRQAD